MPRHRRQLRTDGTRRPETNQQVNSSNNNNGNNGNSNFDLAALTSMLNNIDINKLSAMVNTIGANVMANAPNNQQPGGNEAMERRNQLINAMNILINADKSELLQAAVQLYMASRTNANNINDNG